MTTREELYARAGRGLEICQLLEKDIGTALLALDGLITRSHLKPIPDEYLRLREAVDRQTLGTSLRQMRARLKLQEDLEAVLSGALAARNDLAHQFFSRHALKVMDPDGRTEMLAYLNGLLVVLERGYALAGNVASALVRAVVAEIEGAV
jgi:hypothetical protein